MKSMFYPLALLVFGILLSMNSLFAQNSYDIYRTLINSPFGLTTTGYTGEYEFYLDISDPNLPLIFDSIPIDSIHIIIEAVSIPFYPYCGDTLCMNSNVKTRIMLTVPDSLRSQTGWDSPFGNNDSLFSRIVRRENTTTSPSATLISVYFTNTLGFLYRSALPHSVMKHSYVFYGWENGYIITDTAITYYDLTRGRMKNYPFKANNGVANEADYDIIFSNSEVSWDTISTPYKVFPVRMKSEKKADAGYFGSGSTNQSYIPSSPSPNDYYYYVGDSLPRFTVPEHDYMISLPLNFELINPQEKIVYMPSVVRQLYPQVFPSGYTFKTVLGRYPSHTEIANQDPDTLYENYKLVPVRSALTIQNNPDTWYDETRSVYVVNEGSGLTIEPCVALYDVDLVFQQETYFNYHKDYLDTLNVRFFFHASTTVDSSYGTPSEEYPCFFECYKSGNFDLSYHTINSNTTWEPGNYAGTAVSSNSVLRISKTLRITEGNTLTLNPDVRLEFGVNGQIIVEKGAKLICEGDSGSEVIISAACENFWRGIVVMGQSNAGQVATNQGVVEMEHTHIHNARTGIMAGLTGVYLAYLNSGGIIKIENSAFFNCEVGIDMRMFSNIVLSKPKANVSYIRNTRFETNSTLSNRLTPKYHIRMNKIRGLPIENCVFINVADSLFSPGQRGVGIYATSSTYTVTSLSSNKELSRFENLSEGVVHIVSTNDLCKVQHSTFRNTIRGVTLIGSSSSLIRNNNFEVPASSYAYQGFNPSAGWPTTSGNISDTYLDSYSYANPVGVYLLQSKGYVVEDNDFNLHGGATEGGDNFNYGVVANSTSDDTYGTGIGLVRRNNFGTLDIGLQLEGYNGATWYDTSFVHGVDIKCNEFQQSSSLSYDICVVGIYQIIDGSVRDQGACPEFDQNRPDLPANNIFKRTCDPDSGDYNHWLHLPHSLVSYKYHAFSTLLDSLSPDCSNVLVEFPTQGFPQTLFNCNLQNFNKDQSCPSPTYFPGFDVPEFPTTRSYVDSLIQVYHDKIDGGDTEWLITTVMDLSEQTEQITELLLEYSPFLSDTTLITIFERDIAFSNEELYLIVAANSPLSARAYAKLEEYRPQFTTYMWEAMEGWQTGISARLELERLVEQSEMDFQIMVIRMRAVLRDSLDSDQLSEFISSYGDVLADEEQLGLALWANDTSAVQSHMAGLDTNSLPYLEASWWLAGIDETEKLPYASILALEGHIEANPHLSFVSKEKLAQATGGRFVRQPWPLEMPNEKNSGNQNLQRREHIEELVVYPNPTSRKLTVEIRKKKAQGILSLYNTQGIELLSIEIQQHQAILFLELDNISPGLYFLRHVGKDGVVISTKVVKL